MTREGNLPVRIITGNIYLFSLQLSQIFILFLTDESLYQQIGLTAIYTKVNLFDKTDYRPIDILSILLPIFEQ